MSAAMKRAPEPTPERAALAHAIARAADADVRKAALVKARATADEEVRLARRAVDAAGEAVEAAPSNAARHLTDTALGTAGAAPQTIREARAAAIEAADHLEACRAARDALNAEQVDGHGLTVLLVQDAATAVLRSEARERAVALAARVAEMQRELVAAGSALEWLAGRGVFEMANGRPADDVIRNTVWRMQQTPNQWAIGTVRTAASFAQPTGGNAWAAAFEALRRDADAPLPADD